MSKQVRSPGVTRGVTVVGAAHCGELALAQSEVFSTDLHVYLHVC